MNITAEELIRQSKKCSEAVSTWSKEKQNAINPYFLSRKHKLKRCKHGEKK